MMVFALVSEELVFGMGGRRFEPRQPTFCGADAVREDGFWVISFFGSESVFRSGWDGLFLWFIAAAAGTSMGVWLSQ